MFSPLISFLSLVNEYEVLLYSLDSDIAKHTKEKVLDSGIISHLVECELFMIHDSINI